jgi:ABC-type phosphate transport system substrate-binding protein
LFAAATSAVAIAACGVDVAKEGRVSTTSTTIATTRKALPQRPPGVVAIDGGSEDILTKAIVEEFGRRFATRAELSDGGGEAQGFADLCAGRVDVVDATRTISSAELAACRANGLSVPNPITAGSDALVIATKNEADVGGDCVNVAQVRDMFRAGSPFTNWDQLSFFDLPLRATGRAPGTDIFAFFAFQVLGLDNSATLAQVRSDYLEQPSDAAVRAAVTGDAGLAAELFAQRRLDSRTAAERAAFVQRAIVAADRGVLARIAAVNRENARRRLRVDAAKLIRQNRLEDERAKQAAASMASRQFDLLLATGQQTTGASRAPGTVGFFRFTYYEQFEDQLRPLEIEPGGTPTTSTNGTAVQARSTGRRSPDCIFPSRVTITNASYPLARRIVLYVTTASLKRPEVQALLRFYFEYAQSAATAHQLVAITDQQRDAAITAVTGHPPLVLTRPATAGQPVSAAAPASAVAPSGVPGVAPTAVGTGGVGLGSTPTQTSITTTTATPTTTK